MTATKTKARAVAAALREHVAELLVRKAFAQVERERVDAIQKRELRQQYYYGRIDERQVRITNPRESYLMDDDSAKRYFEKLNAIHLADGFADAARGYCPALVAETKETEAEWALIKAAEEFFPGVTNDKLLCGIKGLPGLETRHKYLDLLCGLCINAPGKDGN
jgi:hypothetical protein